MNPVITDPKFIASADIHLGHKLYNFPELEDDMVENFSRICSMGISNHVDYVVIAGDLFEDNNPRPDIVAQVLKQAERLQRHGIGLLGIAGDHDEPVNNSSWCRVGGVQPVTTCPAFIGLDYYDYSLSPWWDKMVAECKKPELVKWMFLHGQVPSIFKFTQDKKKLDFTMLMVLETFPNLQGVLLGDIHAPLQGSMLTKEREIPVWYCGSPSVNDSSELKNDKRVLHYDGKELKSIPFHQRRRYVTIPFMDADAEAFDSSKYIEEYKKDEFKPVFIIDTNQPTMTSHGHKLHGLYDIGLIRRIDNSVNKKKKIEEATEQAISIRSEMGSGSRTVEVLKTLCTETGVGGIGYNLTLSLLTGSDPTLTLDKFKTEVLTNER